MQSPPPHVCCRGPSHVLKFLASCQGAGTELPWHYAKNRSSSSGRQLSSVGQLRRNQKKILSAATSKATVLMQRWLILYWRALIAARLKILRDFNGDALPSMPQLTAAANLYPVSSGSSSATQLSASDLRLFNSVRVIRYARLRNSKSAGWRSSTLQAQFVCFSMQPLFRRFK
uniref:Secreted protein n=1 Tax=Macrostomum lignano TaxID=282301 RepID=A0A1I8F7F1_9PLAT